MSSLVLDNNMTSAAYQPPVVTINIPPYDNSNDLGQVSVLVSSVLLSAAGFLTMLIGSLSKSRCVEMTCGCTKCTRAVLDDPVV